jgi:hypothetical protein
VIEIYLTFGGLAVLVGFLEPLVEAARRPARGHARPGRAGAALPSARFGVPPRARGLGGDADVGRLPDPLARRVAAFFANVDHLVPRAARASRASLAAQVAPSCRRSRMPLRAFLARRRRAAPRTRPAPR